MVDSIETEIGYSLLAHEVGGILVIQAAGVVHLDHGTDRGEVDLVASRDKNLLELCERHCGV